MGKYFICEHDENKFAGLDVDPQGFATEATADDGKNVIHRFMETIPVNESFKASYPELRATHRVFFNALVKTYEKITEDQNLDCSTAEAEWRGALAVALLEDELNSEEFDRMLWAEISHNPKLLNDENFICAAESETSSLELLCIAQIYSSPNRGDERNLYPRFMLVHDSIVSPCPARTYGGGIEWLTKSGIFVDPIDKLQLQSCQRLVWRIEELQRVYREDSSDFLAHAPGEAKKCIPVFLSRFKLAIESKLSGSHKTPEQVVPSSGRISRLSATDESETANTSQKAILTNDWQALIISSLANACFYGSGVELTIKEKKTNVSQNKLLGFLGVRGGASQTLNYLTTKDGVELALYNKTSLWRIDYTNPLCAVKIKVLTETIQRVLNAEAAWFSKKITSPLNSVIAIMRQEGENLYASELENIVNRVSTFRETMSININLDKGVPKKLELPDKYSSVDTAEHDLPIEITGDGTRIFSSTVYLFESTNNDVRQELVRSSLNWSNVFCRADVEIKQQTHHKKAFFALPPYGKDTINAWKNDTVAIQRISVSVKDAESSKATITMAVSKNDGTVVGQEYTYIKKVDHVLRDECNKEFPTFSRISIWPYVKFSDPWQRYYTYFRQSPAEGAIGDIDIKMTPSICNGEIASECIRYAVRSGLRSVDKWSVAVTKELPKALDFVAMVGENSYPIGSILIDSPEPSGAGAAIKTATIALDFGTSNTAAAFNLQSDSDDNNEGVINKPFYLNNWRDYFWYPFSLCDETGIWRNYGKQIENDFKNEFIDLNAFTIPGKFSQATRLEIYKSAELLVERNERSEGVSDGEYKEKAILDTNANMGDDGVRVGIETLQRAKPYIITDMKGKRIDLGLMFLEQLVLQYSLIARIEGAAKAHWRITMPNTNLLEKGDFGDGMQKLLTTMSSFSGLNMVDLHFYSEAHSAGKFLMSESIPHAGYVAADIGGGTTDISVWKVSEETKLEEQNNPLREWSLKLGGRTILAHNVARNIGRDLTRKQFEDILGAGVAKENSNALEIMKAHATNSTTPPDELFLQAFETLCGKYGDKIKNRISQIASPRTTWSLHETVRFHMAVIFTALGWCSKEALSRDIENDFKIILAGNGSRIYDWLNRLDKEKLKLFFELGVIFAQGKLPKFEQDKKEKTEGNSTYVLLPEIDNVLDRYKENDLKKQEVCCGALLLSRTRRVGDQRVNIHNAIDRARNSEGCNKDLLNERIIRFIIQYQRTYSPMWWGDEIKSDFAFNLSAIAAQEYSKYDEIQAFVECLKQFFLKHTKFTY
jgi:hypothetical protein